MEESKGCGLRATIIGIKDSNGYYDMNLLDQFRKISLDKLRELKKEERRIKENMLIKPNEVLNK